MKKSPTGRTTHAARGRIRKPVGRGRGRMWITANSPNSPSRSPRPTSPRPPALQSNVGRHAQVRALVLARCSYRRGSANVYGRRRVRGCGVPALLIRPAHLDTVFFPPATTNLAIPAVKARGIYGPGVGR